MEKKHVWQDYRLHLLALICTVVAELIGTQKIELGAFKFVLAPLIFSMTLMTLIYLFSKGKVFNENSSHNASKMMGLAGGILIAKLGVSSGASINEVMNAGIPVTLQNLGEGFSFVLALPVAMMFGMNREAVGMTFGVSREANVSLVSDKYGAESPEFRGVMTNYIVGTIFGVIAVSLLISVLSSFSFISPLSLALASGIGSASMMAGGMGTLLERYPQQATQIEAYAAMSNLVSTVIAIYTAIFLGLPMTERAYNVLNKRRKDKNQDISSYQEPDQEITAVIADLTNREED